MRKALIAVIVASALFAVGAFAANFVVTSSDVASGTDSVGSCAEEALVEYTTRPALNQTSDDFELESVIVTFVNNAVATAACDGGDADVAIGSGDGNPATDPTSWDDLTPDDTIGTTGVGVVVFTVPTTQNIEVRPIERVTVLANGNAVATNPA